jgi:Ankyrin repeats (3 copies)/Ankyrin repeats (many copies)
MRLFALFASAVLVAGCFAERRDIPPLVAAACDGNAAAVREIVRSGADPNAKYGALNWTPLMHAIHANQIGSVKALLDSGADVNRTGDDETEPRTKQRNVTPLMMAAGYGYTPIVDLLLRRGADPAPADGDGNRALDYALTGTLYRLTLFECQDSTVRALIAAHAPLDISSDARRGASIKRCNTLALLR